MSMRHKTAMGKTIDMAALAAKNERIRAVGNMNVNARGDIIDNQGNIIKPATSRVNDRYGKTVGNKSAQVRSGPVEKPMPKPKVETKPEVKPEVKQQVKSQPEVTQKAKVTEELTSYELEMNELYEEEDQEIEQLKRKSDSKK